jgi:hypothetical protein
VVVAAVLAAFAALVMLGDVFAGPVGDSSAWPG